MTRAAGPSLTGRGVRVRGRIAPHFLARHALSPADAIPFAPAAEDAALFAAMRASGAIRQATNGYWLDLRALATMEEARRKRLVPIAIAAAVIVAALAMLFYRG